MESIIDIAKQDLDDYSLEIVATLNLNGISISELYTTKRRLERLLDGINNVLKIQQ